MQWLGQMKLWLRKPKVIGSSQTNAIYYTSCLIREIKINYWEKPYIGPFHARQNVYLEWEAAYVFQWLKRS